MCPDPSLRRLIVNRGTTDVGGVMEHQTFYLHSSIKMIYTTWKLTITKYWREGEGKASSTKTRTCAGAEKVCKRLGKEREGVKRFFFSSFSFFSYWGNCNCSCCRIVDWCFLNLPPSRNLRGLWSRSMIRATGEHFSCSRDRDWFFVLSFSLIVERITAIQLRCTTNFKRYSVWRNEKKKKGGLKSELVTRRNFRIFFPH